MRSIQTNLAFPLSSVKPLGQLLSYRQRCLGLTRAALEKGTRARECSPVSHLPLEPFGTVEGLPYGRCPESGSLFLMELPSSEEWTNLLTQVLQYRHSPQAFHRSIAQSRSDNVYAPKLEWIQNTLRIQGIRQPRVLEITTRPSDFTPLLKESVSFSEVLTVDEMRLSASPDGNPSTPVDMAVLLESLDRVDDPERLVKAVANHLREGGLLFVTALVSSGFDVAVLGLRNLYLYPPDRANCFSLSGLCKLLTRSGLSLLEVSTPGVLDVEIVQAHLKQDPGLALSAFEWELMQAEPHTREAFQAFLQAQGLSSFARIVARRVRQ